jgi:hypothetical protein
LVQKIIPQEITDAVINSPKKKRKNVSKSPIVRPVAQDLPENFTKFTTPIPSLTITEAKDQTAAKMDQSFDDVFLRLVGDVPSRRTAKNPQQT